MESAVFFKHKVSYREFFHNTELIIEDWLEKFQSIETEPWKSGVIG